VERERIKRKREGFELLDEILRCAEIVLLFFVAFFTFEQWQATRDQWKRMGEANQIFGVANDVNRATGTGQNRPWVGIVYSDHPRVKDQVLIHVQNSGASPARRVASRGVIQNGDKETILNHWNDTKFCDGLDGVSENLNHPAFTIFPRTETWLPIETDPVPTVTPGLWLNVCIAYQGTAFEDPKNGIKAWSGTKGAMGYIKLLYFAKAKDFELVSVEAY
jgi:hypothetical protein